MVTADTAAGDADRASRAAGERLHCPLLALWGAKLGQPFRGVVARVPQLGNRLAAMLDLAPAALPPVATPPAPPVQGAASADLQVRPLPGAASPAAAPLTAAKPVATSSAGRRGLPPNSAACTVTGCKRGQRASTAAVSGTPNSVASPSALAA